MDILVTGGSGTLGRELVPYLMDAGHTVRATSRRPRQDDGVRWTVTDLGTGEGVREAVAGADAIVHLASATRFGRNDPEVDVAGTARLLRAAADAGVGHLVYVSIVGIDRVPMPYYRDKLAAEELIQEGPVPWTIRRFTQFPQLLDGLLRMLSRIGPVLADPRGQVQPVDIRDVVAQLGDQLLAGPTQRIVEYGGPQVLRFDEVARTWLAARDLRRPVLRLPIPGRVGRALRAGGLTTTATPTGVRTWADFLTGSYGRSVAERAGPAGR
jgi:uncharacterized protein YbjT (DUF2867 family)